MPRDHVLWVESVACPQTTTSLHPKSLRSVTHGPPTPPRGLPLPDFEQGYALGYQRGLADAFHGLRLALLRVGVAAEEVEPIVMTVRKWVR